MPSESSAVLFCFWWVGRPIPVGGTLGEVVGGVSMDVAWIQGTRELAGGFLHKRQATEDPELPGVLPLLTCSSKVDHLSSSFQHRSHSPSGSPEPFSAPGTSCLASREDMSRSCASSASSLTNLMPLGRNKHQRSSWWWETLCGRGFRLVEEACGRIRGSEN